MEVLTLVRSIRLSLVVRKSGENLELVNSNEVELHAQVLTLDDILT